LQVAEQGDEAAVLGGNLADQFGPGFVLVWRAVGKIQSGDIHAGQNQLLQYLWRVAGGAERGDNFGTAQGHA
jgi:hypothetical protein